MFTLAINRIAQQQETEVTSLKEPMRPDLHKLNHFIIRVARIHIGHKELSSLSMEYRKAGLALIEQGISDTLCSLDLDLIPWDTLEQVEVFFHHLDQHITDDIGFSLYETESVPDQVVDLPPGVPAKHWESMIRIMT